MSENKIELQDKTWERLNKHGIYANVYEDQPFIIFQNWDDVSAANQIINETERPDEWRKWKYVYDCSFTVFGGVGGPYSDLRLGEFNAWYLAKNPRVYQTYREAAEGGLLGKKSWEAHRLSQFGKATPSNSESSYLVPEGLIDLGDIAEWGFDDEWSNCANCHVVLRTSPDCHQWKPDYWDDPEYGYVCEECLDPDEYLGYHINNHNSAVNSWLVDPEDYGWYEVDISFESGFHHGMDADPKKIMQMLQEHGIDSLMTYDASQFYTSFNVWVRQDKLEIATRILEHGNTGLPYSQAAELSKALKGQPSEVNVQMYTQNEDGVLEDQDGNTLEF